MTTIRAAHAAPVIAGAVSAALALTCATASAQTGGPAAGDTRAAPATSGTVVVHIDSPTSVELESRDERRGWVVVCKSPCDAALPTDRAYRINGPGVRPSAPISIAPGSRVTLAVDPASSGAQAGAVAVTVVGFVGLAPGVVVTVGVVGGVLLGAVFVCPFVAAFSSKETQNSKYTGCIGDAASYFAQGYASPYVWVPAIVGGVAIALGITWLIATPPTTITLPATSTRIADGADLWRRPVWRTDLDVALPRPTVTNVVDVRF